MNKDDVLKVIEVVVFYYPNAKIGDLVDTAEKWHLFLHDQDYKEVMLNLQTHIKKSVYPPHMADLLKVPELVEKRKYMPGLEDTRLMLLETSEEVPTEEERKEGIAKMKEILLKSGAKYE